MKRKYKYTGNSSFENALHDCKLVDDSIIDDKTFQEADCGLILYYMDRIIEALEKQVSKKVKYSNYDDNGFDEIIPYKAECPVCGYEFEFGEFNDNDHPYCKCGQKLDWYK